MRRRSERDRYLDMRRRERDRYLDMRRRVKKNIRS